MSSSETAAATGISPEIDESLARSSGPHRPGLLIVEDHQLLAQSLSYALTAEGFDVTVGRLDTISSILECFERSGAEIVLLDLDLGGTIGDGQALIAPLSQRGGRVLVVTGSTDRPRLGLCLEHGAVGVLAKSTPYEKLVAAVLDVAAGRQITTEAERQALWAELRAWRRKRHGQLAPFEHLTPRESQVLGALMEGKSCETIAEGWFVSEATVRTQIRAVLTKLGVPSQIAAVAQAQRVGWRPGS